MGPGTWAGIARRIRRQWPWPLALEPGSASWQRTGIPKCPCGTEVVPTLCLVQPPALMRCGTNPLDQPRKLPACRSDLPACKEIPPRGRVVPGKVRGASRCRCCASRPKGCPERTARTATRSRACSPVRSRSSGSVGVPLAVSIASRTGRGRDLRSLSIAPRAPYAIGTLESASVSPAAGALGQSVGESPSLGDLHP